MQVDLWSIGVITYILLCGFPPFYGETVPELFEQIMSADYDYPEDYWNEVSDQAKSFIDALLVVSPKEASDASFLCFCFLLTSCAQRMTAKQALQHPWLNNAGGAGKELKVGAKMSTYIEGRRKETPTTKVRCPCVYGCHTNTVQDILGF